MCFWGLRMLWRFLPRNVFKDEQSHSLDFIVLKLGRSFQIKSSAAVWYSFMLLSSLVTFMSWLFFFVCSNFCVWNVIQVHETIVALRERAWGEGTWWRAGVLHRAATCSRCRRGKGQRSFVGVKGWSSSNIWTTGLQHLNSAFGGWNRPVWEAGVTESASAAAAPEQADVPERNYFFAQVSFKNISSHAMQ